MTTLTHDGILQGHGIGKVELDGMDRDLVDRLHRAMLRLRRMEQALIAAYHPADEMRCPVHFCVGQEAVSAALSVLLRRRDYLFSHHRSHGYYLAKGAPMQALFAELYGKETGANGGKAGSQDISYADCHFYSGAILAGAVAIGVGAAFGEQLQGRDHIVVTAFGEAATEEGVFWEAMNFASLKKLPIVFVCENNRYSTFSPQLDRQPADNLHERVAAFGVASEAIFGNNVIAAYRSLEKALTRARAAQGPMFIQAYTYRWNGHVGPGTDDGQGYRTNDEIDYWKTLCPIKLLEQALAEAGRLDPEKQARVSAEIDGEIAAAFRFAKESAFPSNVDWKQVNYSTAAPMADRLLHDVEGCAFNQYQKDAIPGPY